MEDQLILSSDDLRDFWKRAYCAHAAKGDALPEEHADRAVQKLVERIPKEDFT